MRRILFQSLNLILSLSLSQCASELNRTRKEKRGLPIEKVDLSLVNFEEFYSGQNVTAADYMRDNKLDFLLLIFGSVNCAKCNEKAQLLSTDYLGKHELFLTSREKGFALVGVNTDSGGSRKQFESIMLSPERRSKSGYNFVQWVDSAGTTMRQYLLGDNVFGVPFTVMLSREGIAWRFTNRQPYSIEDLIKAIQATLDGRDAPDPVGGNDSEQEGIKPPTEFPYLAFASKERLSQLSMKGCGNGTTGLGKILTAADLTFIQIDKQDCAPGSVCEQNQILLEEHIAQTCEDSISCSTLTLSLKPPHASICARGRAGQGGKEFFTTFATHFNWQYTPMIDEWGVPVAIPPVNGPITLGFRRDGHLVFSHEGLLPDASDLASIERVLAEGAKSLKQGIKLPVLGAQRFGQSPINIDTANLRQQAKYTVIGAFDRYCIGCLEELEHWSAPGQVVDYCKSRPGFCQVFALEAELAQPNTPASRSAFFTDIKANYLDNRGVKVPLLIDVTEFGDGYSRLFYSYFSPMFESWEGLYGTVIYDREGKILANFKGGAVHETDPVLATLRKLAEYP